VVNQIISLTENVYPSKKYLECLAIDEIATIAIKVFNLVELEAVTDGHWAMRSFHDQKTEINREEMMEFIVHQHTIIFELTSGIAPAKEGLRYFENLNVLQKPNPVK
jgi:hypothetical protein